MGTSGMGQTPRHSGTARSAGPGIHNPGACDYRGLDSGFAPSARPGMTERPLPLEPLPRWRDFGHQVAHQPLVVQRLHRHLARHEPRRAGIDGLAIELDHAFLARIGIDAGEADGERGIAVGADPAQAVEHRLAGLERHLVALEAPHLGGGAPPDIERRGLAHCAATAAATGTGPKASRPLVSRAVWLTCHSGSRPEKSSRWWAPRLSVRRSAAAATVRATSSMLRRSSQSIRCMSNGPPSPGGPSP